MANIRFNRFLFQRRVATFLWFVRSTNQTIISYDVPMQIAIIGPIQAGKSVLLLPKSKPIMAWEKFINLATSLQRWDWKEFDILVPSSIQGSHNLWKFDKTFDSDSISDFRYSFFPFHRSFHKFWAALSIFAGCIWIRKAAEIIMSKTVRWMNFLFEIFVSRSPCEINIGYLVGNCRHSCFHFVEMSFLLRAKGFLDYYLSASEMICGCLSFQSASRKFAAKICTRICRVAAEGKI